MTAALPIVEPSQPSRVVIPMQQHIGAPCKCLVKKGDTVKIGMKIGEPSGFVSSAVHSSVSGVVVDVQPCVLANGLEAQCVIIDNDFKDEWVELHPVENPEAMDAAALSALVQGNGPGGPGRRNVPVRRQAVAAEGEAGYADRQRRGMRAVSVCRSPADAAQGQGDRRRRTKRMQAALGIEKVIIGIEKNKKDAIDAMETACEGDPCVFRRRAARMVPAGR